MMSSPACSTAWCRFGSMVTPYCFLSCRSFLGLRSCTMIGRSYFASRSPATRALVMRPPPRKTVAFPLVPCQILFSRKIRASLVGCFPSAATSASVCAVVMIQCRPFEGVM